MNYPESVQYLYSLGRELEAPAHARTMKFDLANISALAARTGNPQNRFRSVHIAGTNGKGSTAAMIESILRGAGYRTGLFTSPHLERINERIRVAGSEISDEEFAAAFSRLRGLVEEMIGSGKLTSHPSFFECITAMAFDYFARANVEVAVFEVGMGGRFDATNIVVPEVSVITQIAFDHEAFLGHAIEQIAGEKAGIIKAGVPVVSAAADPLADEVIRRRAAELSSPLIEIDVDYRVKLNESDVRGSHVHVSGARDDFSVSLEVPLPGEFQVRNAVTAIAAARVLASRGFKLPPEHIAKGIAAVRWPGRLEQISENPTVFLDGSHNPAGARELAEFLDENFAGRRILLVFGAVRDKSVDEIAELLFPRAASVFLTAPKNSRALSAEALAEITHGMAATTRIVPDPSAALQMAISDAAPSDVVIVTGSLYLVGTLRAWWNSRQPSAAAIST
ncbi:MAG TPA: folylpolyglutamate synthase/dihydrofolate synthase family protein [Candidatus Acidoferrales bacterium]|nr:folylpolyglutamate synthase/dihydrofolate synthase family protein [Candidatus Acidoferrales bacterium]